MKKSFYVLGFLTMFILSSGFLFKILHWPGANILMLTGFVLLNLAYLPTYFYQKYKQAQV